MAKKASSWTKPEGKENLIGIKKVDDSVFKYGVHIPLSFRNEFKKANQMKDVEQGKAEKIKLIFEGSTFDAELRSIRQSSSEKISLQIRYDAKTDLKEYLRKTFATTHEYILKEKDRSKNKTVKIPDHLAEYMEFYKTEKPFEYRVITKKNSNELFAYPFREIFKTRDEIQKARGWIKRIFSELEIKDNDHPLFSLNYRKDQNGLFLNYGSWRIFGVWRKKSQGIYIDLSIPENFDLIEVKEDGGSFTMKDDEEQINLNRYLWDDVMKNEEQVWASYKRALAAARKRFKDFKASPYLYTHSMQLGKAMFEDDYFQKLLDGTIPYVDPISKKKQAWIFQGNPKIYDIDRATEELSEIEWSVTRYKDRMKIGDHVYIWSSGENAGIVAYGVVGSEVKQRTDHDIVYHITKEGSGREDQPDDVVEIKELQKLPERILKEDLLKIPELKDLLIIKSPQGTNFELEQSQHEKLKALIEGMIDPPPPIRASYTIEECAHDLYMEIGEIERWVRSIERKGQAVLYGPPGTGKTYAAEKLAKTLISEGEGSVETLQFHPAYSYEDFMQGIRPVTENGKLTYEMVKGRFMEFCDKIREKEGKSVLIIDEINRANLSRVFGELLYLLEYRDKTIPLAGGKNFSIPENLYILGTMNTADRSIAIVDHALRRRFAFLELPTNYELLRAFHKDTEFPVESLVEILKGVNATIGDQRYEVGISYFLKENLHEEIQDVWEMEVVPYLEEYFFDQPGKVKEYHWEKIEGRLLNDE